MIKAKVTKALDIVCKTATLERYGYSFDMNGEKSLDDNPSETYTIKASIQQTDMSLEWQEGGVNRVENRSMFVHYPLKNSDGNELNFEPVAQESSEEGEYVDVIVHRGRNYDIIGMANDYPEYGYQHYIITRV